MEELFGKTSQPHQFCILSLSFPNAAGSIVILKEHNMLFDAKVTSYVQFLMQSNNIYLPIDQRLAHLGQNTLMCPHAKNRMDAKL